MWKQTNVVVSPFSMAGALAALAVGAAQGTKVAKQLEAAVGPNAAAQLNAYARAVEQARGTRLKIATSVWHTGAVRPPFVDTLRTLGAHCAQLEGVEPINAWVHKATDGNIPSLITSLPPTSVCVVVNAVFFQASWKKPFDPTKTKPATFHTLDGSPRPCQLMRSDGPLMLARGTGCVSVALEHGTSGRFVSIFVLPNDLGPDALDAALAARPPLSAHTSTNAELFLPRFRAEFGPVDMRDVLAGVGVVAIFDPVAAAAGLAPIGNNVVISNVVHKVTWAIDEAGATATAATALIYTLSASIPKPSVTINRPFGLVLLDTVANIVLFSGRIVTV
jgi:serpin B